MQLKLKKFDKSLWHGIDADKATSLFEYGLLVRYITKEKEWQCVYRNLYDPTKFSYSWISEQDMSHARHVSDSSTRIGYYITVKDLK